MTRFKALFAPLALAFVVSASPLLPLALPTAVIGLALSNTACPLSSPKIQSSVNRAAKASAIIADRYVETVKFVDTLYDGGVLDRDTKDTIMKGLITFGENGKKFNALLRGYLERQKKGETLPSDIWTTIAQNFDELSAQFLTVLNFLPQAKGLGDNKAFRAISAAVLALAQVLASHSIIPDSQRIQLETEVDRYGL